MTFLEPTVARRSLIVTSVINAVLVGGAVMTVFPFIWMLSVSLKLPQDVFTYPPHLIPHPFAVGNYAKAWSFVPFLRFYINSFIVAGAVTIGQVITCSLAAYAFARLRFPLREPLFMGMLGTMMIPGQVTMIPTFLIIHWLGWINTYWALIVPGLASAFGTFLLRQFFATLPKELEDAAIIDGCGRLGVLRRIIFPLSLPAIAALSIFTFMGSWNSFLWPLIVENHTTMFTVPLGLTYFQSEYVTEWSLLMAAAAMATVPVLVVFVVFQRQIIRGIALTGLKS